jgi:hypothetical protein
VVDRSTSLRTPSRIAQDDTAAAAQQRSPSKGLRLRDAHRLFRTAAAARR